MTVAVAVKVFDGIVLATDSATLLTATPPVGPPVHQVYNNADKLFHLHRDLPIGMMTWGGGDVGGASIATLAKDLRRRFMGKDTAHRSWNLQSWYTLEEVTKRVAELFFDELGYTGATGFLIAGYSSNERHPEAWQLESDGSGARPVPFLKIPKDAVGWEAFAQGYEALARLWRGIDLMLEYQLAPMVAPHVAVPSDLLLSRRVDPAQAPMPFPDAISLAKFMVDVAVGYQRFSLGPDTVGGFVEVAGISRHEGFKWISRKHYYSATINPKDPHP